jgi:hypothetical protein
VSVFVQIYTLYAGFGAISEGGFEAIGSHVTAYIDAVLEGAFEATSSVLYIGFGAIL